MEGRGEKRTSEIKVRWFLGSSIRQDEKWTRTGAWEWSQGPEPNGQPVWAPLLSFAHGPQPGREVKLPAPSTIPWGTRLYRLEPV